ncbi:MAG: extracellular solute-binding protein [Pleomorphochaeta sp.]
MRKKFLLTLICIFMSIFTMPLFANGQEESSSSSEDVTEIVYWQYFYETKKNLMDDLIAEFEAANPDIKVVQQTFPYENYNTKVATSVPTGKGPNVINLFYGWLPTYMEAGYLQPLPENEFPTSEIEDTFFPLVKAAKFDGQYYAIPTAVRSLALFWNKDLFREAGLDPNSPPTTLEETVKLAKELTKFDKNGNYVQEGFGLQLNGQIHHWIREILIRQFGGAPYSEDGQMVTYNNQAGYDAFKFATDLQLKEKIGMPMFMTDDVTAFKAGALAMDIDGSFRLGTYDKLEDLDYGVTTIPTYNGIDSNFASFWANGITSFTSGKELEASAKFLKFLTSDEVMERWLANVGELPAKPSVAMQDKYINDPKYGPFLKGLTNAHATMFYDENAQRQVWLDAWDQVVINNMSIKEAVDTAAKQEQAILDKHFNN